MIAKKNNPLIFISNILIFLIVLFFDMNNKVDISIRNATPLLIIPLLTAFSVFSSLEAATVVGLFSGAMLDSVAAGSYCFNTISLFIMGAVVNLAANNLFNKNMRGVAALTLITAVLYFTAYWLTFYAFGVGIKNSLIYLMSYGFPSAIYSSIFIFPFYFIYKNYLDVEKERK